MGRNSSRLLPGAKGDAGGHIALSLASLFIPSKHYEPLLEERERCNAPADAALFPFFFFIL